MIELGRRQRPGKAVALHLGAAHGQQAQLLFRSFHPLGHHIHAHVTRHRQRGTHHGLVIATARQGADKGPVYLQPVDGEAFEPGQRGIAGAEIIQGKAAAQLHQRMEYLQVTRILVHQRAFGQLQLQHAGGDLIALHQPAHIGCEIAALQLHRRQIHRYRQQQAGRRPARLFGASLGQHPASQFDNQPAALGQANEFAGQHQPA